jgi:hypothetical protein
LTLAAITGEEAIAKAKAAVRQEILQQQSQQQPSSESAVIIDILEWKKRELVPAHTLPL